MKTLIFTLIFPTLVMAAAGDPGEMRLSDAEINQRLISVARDVENERILEGVSDLQDCKRNFRPNSSGNRVNDLQNLQTCVNGKFKGRSAEEIKAISDKLSLETYNLIPSKTVKNITEYLTKKLYRNITGIDVSDDNDPAKRIREMKFNAGKKQVDQKVFFELYKNQVAKNVLYEVSRFCFLDLRRSEPTASDNSFMEHWNNLNDFSSTVDAENPPSTIGPVNDVGSAFGSNQAGQSASTTDSNSYENMFRNIFGSSQNAPIPSSQKLNNFFFFCGKQIELLCKAFEQNKASAPTTVTVTTASTTGTTGAKACLAKTRLTSYKRAMAAAEDIYKKFSEDNGSNFSIALDRNEMVQRYQGGSGPNEKSVNALTNSSSADFLEATKNMDNSEAQDCASAGNGGTECENFIIVDDSRERIQNNTDLVYLAKKEAERERVAALVRGNEQSLKDYLEENYPDLKAQLEKDPTIKNQLENLIAQKWEARRVALQEEIILRLGKRQINQTEATTDDANGVKQKDAFAKVNANDALNEKTRLAQVVFFNNIISSSLELKTASGQSLGRNVQALDDEIAAAENEVQSTLFDNLKTTLGSSGGSSGGSSSGGLNGNESVTNIDFLDEFIGIPKTP